MSKEKTASSRSIKEWLTLIISIIAVIVHVGCYTVLRIPSVKFYAWHLLIGLLLLYINTPLGKGKELSPVRKTVYKVIDVIMIAGTLASCLYIILNFDVYIRDMSNNIMTTELFVLGILMTVVVLEASRRTLGNVLVIVAIVALLYAHFGKYIPGLFGHRGYTWQRIIMSVYSDRGVFGVPIATSANTVYVFLLFAAILGASGADKIFQDIAFAFAGSKRGGPAKMAIIASCLFGMISGSSVANIVSTGVFTIPLMKKNGYRAEFAGAVEAVASTGGQIMPPIMGAAAFVMAELAGVSYGAICVAALLPALMYYVALFKMVDLEAARYHLSGIPEDQLPKLGDSLKHGFKLIIPIAVLLFMLIVQGSSPMVSALWASAVAIVCGFIDSSDRLTPAKLLKAIENAAKSTITVIAACATAGIVVSVFALTGLGLKFSNYLVQIGGSSLILSLILSTVVCIILGMGLPTTASYIVVATAISGALIQLGVSTMATHLFLLYYACLASITPPVAVAAYAAAGIAEADPMKLGLTAVKLGILGFIMPYAFTLNQDYLQLGLNFQTLMTWISAYVVCISLACAFQGYVESEITWPERALFVVAAGLAITPGLVQSLAGLAIFAVLYYGRKWQAKKATAA